MRFPILWGTGRSQEDGGPADEQGGAGERAPVRPQRRSEGDSPHRGSEEAHSFLRRQDQVSHEYACSTSFVALYLRYLPLFISWCRRGVHRVCRGARSPDIGVWPSTNRRNDERFMSTAPPEGRSYLGRAPSVSRGIDAQGGCSRRFSAGSARRRKTSPREACASFPTCWHLYSTKPKTPHSCIVYLTPLFCVLRVCPQDGARVRQHGLLRGRQHVQGVRRQQVHGWERRLRRELAGDGG